MQVYKRNGEIENFDKNKIITAINKAFLEVDGILYETETAEDIALEVATALNEAEAEKKALDAEKVAKEKEKTRVLEAKRAAVDNMLDAVCDYLVASGEGDLITDVKDIETDTLIEMLDDLIKMTKSLEKLKDLQFPLFNDKPVAKKIDADKAIMDFLKGFDL